METSKVPNNYMENTLLNVIYFYSLGADIIITYFVPQLLDWLVKTEDQQGKWKTDNGHVSLAPQDTLT